MSELLGDVDCKDINFQPIGSIDKPFKGTLKGNSYKIRNVEINSSSEFVGVFGFGTSSRIENIKFENVNIISNSSHVATLFGKCIDSEMINITITTNQKEKRNIIKGTSNSASYISAISAFLKNSKINGAKIKNTIICKKKKFFFTIFFIFKKIVAPNYNYVGGICGAAFQSELNDCYNVGVDDEEEIVLEGKRFVGGICGLIESSHFSKSGIIRGSIVSHSDSKNSDVFFFYF